MIISNETSSKKKKCRKSTEKTSESEWISIPSIRLWRLRLRRLLYIYIYILTTCVLWGHSLHTSSNFLPFAKKRSTKKRTGKKCVRFCPPGYSRIVDEITLFPVIPSSVPITLSSVDRNLGNLVNWRGAADSTGSLLLEKENIFPLVREIWI